MKTIVSKGWHPSFKRFICLPLHLALLAMFAYCTILKIRCLSARFLVGLFIGVLGRVDNKGHFAPFVSIRPFDY